MPVVLPAADESSKSFNNRAVGAFNLTVALEVVGCFVDQLGLEGNEDVLPKSGSELRALVGPEAMREAVVVEDVLDEDLCRAPCRQLLKTNSETKHFGQRFTTLLCMQASQVFT